MSKFKIVNLIDKLFITISTFLIVYAWINFYIRDLFITFIFSLIFTFALVYVLFYFVGKKETKKHISKKKIEDINLNFLAFKLSSKIDKLNLLYSILKINHNPLIKDEKIIFSNNEKTYTYIMATEFTKIDQNELLNILDRTDFNTDYLYIVCNSFSSNINTKIFKNREIHFIDKEKLYTDYFEKNNLYPDCSNINTTINKLNLVQILKLFFLPHKAKSYFICGLILIFSSIVLPYHVYYLIFGSVLMLFAIICKLLPKFTN